MKRITSMSLFNSSKRIRWRSKIQINKNSKLTSCKMNKKISTQMMEVKLSLEMVLAHAIIAADRLKVWEMATTNLFMKINVYSRMEAQGQVKTRRN